MRKRWLAMGAVAAGLVAVCAAAAHAGMVCDQAAMFDYKSPALNWHCAIEFLWELMV